MKINQNKVVLLHYELSVDGKSVENNDLDYIHGTHLLLPKFEQELEGLEPTQSFAFTLSPEEGYGTYEADKRINLSKSAFMVDGRLMEEFLVPGRRIPMLDAAGQVVQGLVCEVKEDVVTMDFNHPMAGKTLHFTGTVVSVRAATSKELEEGLHGEYLPPEEKKHCKKHKAHYRQYKVILFLGYSLSSLFGVAVIIAVSIAVVIIIFITHTRLYDRYSLCSALYMSRWLRHVFKQLAYKVVYRSYTFSAVNSHSTHKNI